jgi:hypothetical protein
MLCAVLQIVFLDCLKIVLNPDFLYKASLWEAEFIKGLSMI